MIFKLPYIYAHFICQQDNAQNPSSQASTVHELRTSRCTSWIQKGQKNQRTNFQHPLNHRKSKGIPEKTSTSASWTLLKLLTMWITTNCGKFSKRWEYQTMLPASCETVMHVKKQQNRTWNNRLVPNWERSTSGLYIVSLLIQLICRVHHEKRWSR